MGIERGHYAVSGGYRGGRDYGAPRGGGGYDRPGKHYDIYDKYDTYGNGSLNGKHDQHYDNGAKFQGGGHAGPEQAILGLEKQIVNVKRDMNQAIQEATTKDNEKFDLIFSILTELQRRQASLEESVRGLRQVFGPDGPRPQGQPGVPPFPKPGVDMPMPNGAGMGMPMGGQGFMMANGAQMGQQFVAPDGTPMQVVVMSPSQASQMYGMMPMMPPGGGMPGSYGVVCDSFGQPTEQPAMANQGQEGSEQQAPLDAEAAPQSKEEAGQADDTSKATNSSKAGAEAEPAAAAKEAPASGEQAEEE
eukprot:TRINITY_DN114555_c0_g1_i1.p1 TRINITY_DN114555_c0_g1~~TRINITY_DN114555_c0_g1_i1.p1  ORF type:complete len:317 (+),score=86.94 TRINITY_DN114555_c0_g1_i1:41-952(+)